MGVTCNSCLNDGDCLLQSIGVSACSSYQEKTTEQKIKDLDNSVSDLTDKLGGIADQYESYGYGSKMVAINKAIDFLKLLDSF